MELPTSCSPLLNASLADSKVVPPNLSMGFSHLSSCNDSCRLHSFCSLWNYFITYQCSQANFLMFCYYLSVVFTLLKYWLRERGCGYMFVCTCAWVSIGCKSALGIFLNHSAPRFLRQALSLSLELPDSDRLAGHGASRTLGSLITSRGFFTVLGIQVYILILEQ